MLESTAEFWDWVRFNQITFRWKIANFSIKDLEYFLHRASSRSGPHSRYTQLKVTHSNAHCTNFKFNFKWKVIDNVLPNMYIRYIRIYGQFSVSTTRTHEYIYIRMHLHIAALDIVGGQLLLKNYMVSTLNEYTYFWTSSKSSSTYDGG